MTTTSLTKRALLLCAALSLLACTEQAPRFHNTDITGSDFGKDFNLTDHRGQARSLADFRGKAVVVFFGFTHCPDVCPTTLAQMKAVKQQLGADGERLQVLFITVDPERDTRELLEQYVPAFDESFIGLYGDAAQTEHVAKEFKVYYKKVPGSGADSYTMDHSAASYAYDPQGRLRLYLKHGQSTQALAEDLRLLLEGR